jgi:predicted Zn-dependent protease
VPEKTVEPFAAIRNARSLSSGDEDPSFTNVQEFLQRFGYLRSSTFSESRLDDPTAEALARYQEYHGLPETGAFDDLTRDQMTTHRCGLPDLENGVAFSTRCDWPHTNLTFAFEDGTNDVAGSAEFQAMRNAFATWAAAVPVTFTETATNQNPDITIDWRPADDPDHSMVGGVLAHADFPPACGVVTNTLPKPVHFDDSEHQWVVGTAAGSFDVETVGLHELGHILGLQHSDVAGSVMFPTVSSNSTKRALTADDLGGIRELYPVSVLTAGTYTIRQRSSGRFLDAHESADRDFRLVTRPAQNNDTQRWQLQPVGAVYMIRQKSTGRFLDAHQNAANDFGLVTRPPQSNDTQQWVVVPSSGGSSTIRQLSNGRFVDAHESADNDFRLVTRPAQNNDTQRWLLANVSGDTFTVRQKSNGRFVDAHVVAADDFAVVTRTNQNNDTQRWIFAQVGAVYTMTQKSNGRFVDAHESADNDFGLVTRTAQNNDTQRWVVLPVGDGSFTIQQLSGRRFVDAHESAANDFSVVTRTVQNNNTQRWLIDEV